MAAKKTANTSNELVATLNAAKSFIQEYAAMKMALVSDTKTVMEVANGFMMAIKEAATLRIASIGDVKPQPTTTAPTKPTTKKAEPKATKATKTAKTAPKATKADRDAAADAAAEVLMADKKALKKLGLKFVAYKESQIILGDTKAIKDSLKALQTSQWGVYHFMAPATAPNGGGFAWAVNNKTADKVAKVLGIRYKKAQ